MEEKNKEQDYKIQGLKEYFKTCLDNVEKNITKDVAHLDGKYQEFERKNCQKHDLIFDKLGKMEGKFEERMEVFKKEAAECYVSKEEAKPLLSLYQSFNRNLVYVVIILTGIVATLITALK